MVALIELIIDVSKAERISRHSNHYLSLRILLIDLRKHEDTFDFLSTSVLFHLSYLFLGFEGFLPNLGKTHGCSLCMEWYSSIGNGSLSQKH